MTSRRDFLAGAATVGALPVAKVWAAKTSGPEFPFAEFEQRIAKRDFRGMTKDILPTPAMVVDLDLFQANVRHMADTAKANGINVRPHVKVHKSVDVAKHQIAHGAIGLTCATVAEAELFSGAGIQGVLWTKQPASVNNIQRAVLLSKKDPTFMFVADDPQVVDWVDEAAAAHDARLRIAVSVYAGMARQGMDGGQPALELAQKIEASKRMKFEGFMAYSGGAAHTKGFEARQKRSMEVLAGARESRDLAKKAGLPVNIMTGGSTGTYNIDHETGLSELEAGTYVFMDTEYFIVGGKDGDDKMYNDFKPAHDGADHGGREDAPEHRHHRLRRQGAGQGHRPGGREAVDGGSARRGIRRAALERRRARAEAGRPHRNLLHQPGPEHQRVRPVLHRPGRADRGRVADHGPRRPGGTAIAVCGPQADSGAPAW